MMYDASGPVSRVLSSTAIYLGAPLPVRSSHLPGETGPVVFPSTVLLRIEFTAPVASTPAGELLPHLSTLTQGRPGRYLSVALVLKSPSAGVTRYPCPMEPGLSSRTAFRPVRAAVQPTCSPILSHRRRLVNRPTAHVSQAPPGDPRHLDQSMGPARDGRRAPAPRRPTQRYRCRPPLSDRTPDRWRSGPHQTV